MNERNERHTMTVSESRLVDASHHVMMFRRPVTTFTSRREPTHFSRGTVRMEPVG